VQPDVVIHIAMATAIWRHKQQHGRRMSSRISLWQRKYGGASQKSCDVTAEPQFNVVHEKKNNIYCLDVVTSISVMIRMIKITHFFNYNFRCI
jgi:hypothetical protein